MQCHRAAEPCGHLWHPEGRQLRYNRAIHLLEQQLDGRCGGDALSKYMGYLRASLLQTARRRFCAIYVVGPGLWSGPGLGDGDGLDMNLGAREQCAVTRAGRTRNGHVTECIHSHLHPRLRAAQPSSTITRPLDAAVNDLRVPASRPSVSPKRVVHSVLDSHRDDT